MSFDFPNTPAIGDLFQDASSGAVYRWNGYAWVGGVTGIGLQTIKETRYLVAGPITHIRDPKNSSGLGDIWLLGACSARLAQTWASGQVALSGGGGIGALTIKWKYPLPASASGVVGASSTTVAGAASSFDTVLTANGAGVTAGTVVTAGTAAAVNGGAGGVAGSTGDENYAGMPGAGALYTGAIGFTVTQSIMTIRDIIRRGAPANAVGAAITALAGDPGFIIVREYLNP